jgi:hypothetical protein
MKLWFGQGTEKDAITYTPVLSPLDAGSHFIFYVMNDCPIDVAGALPDRATATVVGETTRRSAPLNLPHRTPVMEQIMFFPPSDTQWVRQVSCQ